MFYGFNFDGWLYFKTHPETLQEYMEHHAAVFAPSENKFCRITAKFPSIFWKITNVYSFGQGR